MNDYDIQVRENRLIIVNNHSFTSAEKKKKKDEEKSDFLKEFLESQLSK